MNIILLGAPGSGKGTQAALLVKELGLTHINPGSIFREELAAGTELGWKVSGALQRGELVPDEIVTEAVFSRVGTLSTGFLFDGFPRTIAQAKALELRLDWGSDLVLHLDAPLGDLKDRLLNRGRADDLAPVIEERFRWFEQYTLEVVRFYESHPGFFAIDATLPVEQVFANIQESINIRLKL